MNPLPESCFPHSAPIPHQFVMKVYVDAWIYVTEKFVNMGNIELYEGVLRYEKADYPPIPNFITDEPLFITKMAPFWGDAITYTAIISQRRVVRKAKKGIVLPRKITARSFFIHNYEV